MPRLIPRKWRPPLSLVVGGLVLIVLVLPIIGLLLARLADNQFVRETERSLIAQAAIMAEAFATALEAGETPDGLPLSEAAAERLEDRFYPVEPTLVATRNAIMEPDATVRAVPHMPDAAYRDVASHLSALAVRAQKTTLAGYRFLDTSGRIIASSGSDTGNSLLHVPQVQIALRGEPATALRYREPLDERHALSSISRDTAFRVHVAYPVISEARVVGAVYLTRTPIDLRKFLYRERFELARMTGIMALGALVVGFVFWRVISRPIRALRTQSHEVATGRRASPEPIGHYGVSELADLGESLLQMARALTERADAIRTYTDHVTHELKSPVTSIVGAAELLETTADRLTPERRAQLLAAIQSEGLRMDALLGRLRDLARARSLRGGGSARLVTVARDVANVVSGPDVEVSTPDAEIPLSPEELEIVLTQLFRNAGEHGANRVTVTWDGATLIVRDDGRGISAANRAKILDPFFTTRRDAGGTGLGLAICAAIAERHGASLSVGSPETGAEIRLTFPV